MAEAAVCHVELHLPEDGFGFDASPAPVFESFFRCQQFPSLPFVSIQSVVDLDCSSVSFGFVAQAPQWALLTVLRAVACAFAPVTACGLRTGGADASHVLSHRADIVVFGCVVVEVVVMERIGFVAGTLFDVEAVVFDVGLHAGLVHEAVVLFRTIAGVGDRHRGQMPVTVEYNDFLWIFMCCNISKLRISLWKSGFCGNFA